MNMLSRRVKVLFQRLGVAVRKSTLLVLLILFVLLLSSCNVATVFTNDRIAELEKQVEELNEQLDNVYDLFTDISLNVVQANCDGSNLCF